MIKVLNVFSLTDDKWIEKAERLYVFPFMNTAGFYGAYGGSSYFPYFIMIKYRDY